MAYGTANGEGGGKMAYLEALSLHLQKQTQTKQKNLHTHKNAFYWITTFEIFGHAIFCLTASTSFPLTAVISLACDH